MDKENALFPKVLLRNSCLCSVRCFFGQRFEFFCTQQVVTCLKICGIHRAQQHSVGDMFCYWQRANAGFGNHVVAELWRKVQQNADRSNLPQRKRWRYGIAKCADCSRADIQCFRHSFAGELAGFHVCCQRGAESCRQFPELVCDEIGIGQFCIQRIDFSRAFHGFPLSADRRGRGKLRLRDAGNAYACRKAQ